MTCAVLRPRAGNRSIGISHCLGGLAGKSNAKPSCSRVTVKTPLRVWKRTGHVVWFRSVSTWADANVACPQRSISTSGVNQRKSKLPSARGTIKAVVLCLFSPAILCMLLSGRNAESMHTPAGLPANSSPVNAST